MAPAGWPLCLLAAAAPSSAAAPRSGPPASSPLPMVSTAPFERSGSAAAGLVQRCAGKEGRTGWAFHDLRGIVESRRVTKGLRGWRRHIETGDVTRDSPQRGGGTFSEVSLGCEGSTHLSDSVLILPGLASEDECAHLVRAADSWCGSGEWNGGALRRIQCHSDGVNLDGRSHALTSLILSRALWHLEQTKPDLMRDIFPQWSATDSTACETPAKDPPGEGSPAEAGCGVRERAHLADMSFTWSGLEPMLNRYTAGGEFEPHEDSERAPLGESHRERAPHMHEDSERAPQGGGHRERAIGRGA